MIPGGQALQDNHLTVWSIRHTIKASVSMPRQRCLAINASAGGEMGGPKDQLLGSIDLLILKALEAGPLHGYGIAARIQKVSDEALKLGEGTMYPALHRLAQSGYVRAEWKTSETNRQARFYSLTPKGKRKLAAEEERWAKVTSAVSRFLRFA
jgi:transcriptional regulator